MKQQMVAAHGIHIGDFAELFSTVPETHGIVRAISVNTLSPWLLRIEIENGQYRWADKNDLIVTQVADNVFHCAACGKPMPEDSDWLYVVTNTEVIDGQTYQTWRMIHDECQEAWAVRTAPTV